MRVKLRPANVVLTIMLLASAFTMASSFYQLPVQVYAQAITLSPAAGGAGTTVSVTGTGFAADTSCSVSSTGPAGLISSSTCSMQGGTITSASFVVTTNPTPGTYQITVTGSPSGDKAFQSFSVPSMTLTPIDGPTGTTVAITGSGFGAAATACTSVTSTTVGLVTSVTLCTIAGGSINAGTGSFVIGAGVAPGTYTIIVTTDDLERVTSTIKVDTTPKITLNPVLGPPGQVVKISQNGGQFSSGDTSCSITGTWVTLQSCIISNGVLQSTSSFQVNVAATAGPFTVTVTGSLSGVTATATFTVTTATPTIVVTPQDGPLGTRITVQGTGFSTSDFSCQITAIGPPNNIVASQTCSVGGGKVTGAFTVGASVATNTIVSITVTGNLGDTATTSFTLDGTPVIAFAPASPQPPGATILVSLTGTGQFSSGDTSTCTISSNPGGLFSSSACVISAGGTSITGTFFVVGNVQAGKTYLVTVKGSLGDSASASFTVVSAVTATVFVSPSDAPPGSTVTVSGVGFPGLDFACTLTSTPSNLFAATPAPTCTISSGKITGSFKVASGASGAYTVTVTSSSGPPNGQGSAAFKVDTSPTLAFNGVPTPGSGSPGQNIQLTIATGQLSSGSTSCTISSSPGGLFASSACHIAGLGTDLTGTFFVTGNVPTGSSYTVLVTGNFGDTAVGTFTITVTTSLVLTPSFGSPGQTISFVGRGLQFTDSACTLTSTTDPNNGAMLISSPKCSISGGTATGTFAVNSMATVAGNPYTMTLTGNPGADTVTASFTLSPIVTLSPTSGVAGTVVSVSGFGFSSAATSCSLLPTPAGLFATNGCSLVVPGPPSSGQIAGTFVVASAIPAGSYVVTVTDSTGVSASAVFVYGSPSAQVTITPNIITPPTTGLPFSVGVTGSGFNGADSSCSVTVSLPITVSGTCTMSGGTASATLLVPLGTSAGLYLVTVIGVPSGDFASNYLAVNAITTMVTTTSTTTSFTSSTATQTTSTTTMSSTSFTTTTQQTTGFSTWIFTSATLTTIFGQSTEVLFTTTFSTFTSFIPTTMTVVATSTSTLGQIVQPAFRSDASSNAFGLVALISIGISMLLKRRV